MARLQGCVIALLCVGAPAFGQDSVTVVTLHGGLSLLQGHPGGNILVAPGRARVAIVDAQSASASAHVLAALRRVTDRPVALVLNTHYHEDHIGGNSVFRAMGAVVLGHERLAPRARVDTTVTELQWHREAAANDDLPTVLVRRDTTIALGGITLDVLTFGGAHTDGDLAFYFREANVLHTGDILEVDAFPFVDWWGGGSLSGMIDAVDRLLAVSNDATQIVPGHGRPVDRAHLLAYRRMLVEVGDAVESAVREAADLETTMGRDLAGSWSEGRGGASAGRRFVGILYLGLRVNP